MSDVVIEDEIEIGERSKEGSDDEDPEPEPEVERNFISFLGPEPCGNSECVFRRFSVSHHQRQSCPSSSSLSPSRLLLQCSVTIF
jgi:hypothetical protein